MHVQSDALCFLKYMSLILLIFFHTRISIASSFKKNKVKLDLLTDIDMLLMLEQGIRGGIYHSIYQYGKANSKYTKDYEMECR